MLLRLLTRVWRVGGLSLAALIVSGTILILFAVNVLNTKSSYFDDERSDINQAVFRVGSQLSPQAWLTVLGVGFDLLSYGFTETYTHVFDTWCSSQARRNKGPALNDARYLNSMPRATLCDHHSTSLWSSGQTAAMPFMTLTRAGSIGARSSWLPT